MKYTGIAKPKILEISKHKEFIVDRRDWRDQNKRRKIRELIKEGLVYVSFQNKHVIGVRATVAQLVQPRICNAEIIGSSPICGSTIL